MQRSLLPIFFIQMAPADVSSEAFWQVTPQQQKPVSRWFASAGESSARVGQCPGPAMSMSLESVSSTFSLFLHITCKLPMRSKTSSQDCLQGSIVKQSPSKLSAKLSISDVSIQAHVSVSPSHEHSFCSPGNCVWFHHHSPSFLISLNCHFPPVCLYWYLIPAWYLGHFKSYIITISRWFLHRTWWWARLLLTLLPGLPTDVVLCFDF